MARLQTQSSRDADDGEMDDDDEHRRRLDAATILGFAAAFGLVVAAMTIGGTPGAFVDAPAILIVLGGTLGVTVISFSMSEIFSAFGALSRSIAAPVNNPRRAGLRMLRISEVVRRQGLLIGEQVVDAASGDPFAHRAMIMVLDGLPGEEIEDVLEQDIMAMRDRHDAAAGVLRRAAEVAPAMGLIGTLIGLVQMLGNLDDPSSIGPNMAIALLTTFYGAVLSTMVFSPLASKLERSSADEVLVARVYAVAAASIGRKENPRRLETLINALLPPAKRLNEFD